ncbi:hypothetical protein [Aureimonas psammosilenae]|uniref:hypothetical protein n=1 Tax=Aureimonas psammosilenae TaxID=2495496 RepID=UPI001260C326|nr:hypothetical protein [Aureimonas psammosilenae]
MAIEPVLLGFPNRIDEAAISGGNWPLPLGNIQNRRLAKIARSASLNPADTVIVMDFGRSRTLRIFALVAHTISLNGRMRITASANADMSEPTYDSGEIDVWGSLTNAIWDLNELEWENDNFWLGGYTEEEIAGFTATSTHIMPTDVSGRYWRIAITDSNDAGYIDIGRIFAGPAWQPEHNFSWGASLGFETRTAIETALDDAEFFDEREPRRVVRFTLNYLDASEGYGRALELTRRAGISKEVFVVSDPADEGNGLRRNFMGRLNQLSPLEAAMWMNGGPNHSMAFEIKELR